jgi:hypothetical protein
MSEKRRRPLHSRKVRLLRAGSAVVGVGAALAIGVVSAGGASAVTVPVCPSPALPVASATTSVVLSTICQSGYTPQGVRWQ